MVENKVIVIKREGNKLLFPTNERKEVDAPFNAPPKQFFMCRVKSYDPVLGKMYLKIDSDNVNSDAYRISVDVNSHMLSPLFIKEISIEGRSVHPGLNKPVPKNTFNINSTSSVYEKTSRLELVKLDIELPVKDICFHDGKVTFEHYIQIARRKITFEIYNPFIKKEHDSIKNYFPQVLNAGKFAISIKFEYQDNQILKCTCDSPHITKIDEKLFEHVEEMYINDYIINSEAEVSDLKELALEISKNIGSENMQDQDIILNKIITREGTKHYYHLRYLSDKHQASSFNIHVTGKPLSFIFLLTDGNDYYIVWETYATKEATYVWKISNHTTSDLASEVNIVVDRIKWLRQNNKMTYIKTRPANFKRIEHEYAGEDMGFKKWKFQLEQFVLKDGVGK